MKEKKENNFYVDKIKQIEFCDNKALVFTGNEYILPYEIEQSKGDHSLENCDGNCMESQIVITKEVSGKFKEFPNCCKFHKKLTNLEEFDKKEFKNIPNSIANKVMFAYSHILNNIDRENWDIDIQNYLHYVARSFGSFPSGFGEPFYLSSYYAILIEKLDYIKSSKSDTIDSKEVKKRVNKLLRSLKNILEPSEEDESNFEIVLSVYNEWYKIFPFDISYFKHLKLHFKNTLPIHTGKTRYNKYSKETIKEAHTKESLSKILIAITKDILQNINGATLYEKGLLTGIENKKLELLINQRKNNLKKFETKNISDIHKYRKALNFWFKGEKKFIQEITPLLKQVKRKKLKKTYKLEELFKSKKIYNKAIDILEKNNFIEVNNGLLNWIFVETKEYKTKQTIIALFTVLEIKQYLIQSPKSIYKYIDESFLISINKGTYSKSSNGFKKDFELSYTKNYNYISLFNEIL